VFEGGRGAELVVALYGDAAQDILCMDYFVRRDDRTAGESKSGGINTGLLSLLA
jgi:hypothetical protein